MIARQHVRCLCHEMNATKHDVRCLVIVSGEACKLEGVATEVCPANDFTALVVVTEDEQFPAQGLFRFTNHRFELTRDAIVYRSASGGCSRK